MLRNCAKPAASAMMPSKSAIQRFKFQPHEAIERDERDRVRG
jgi:hypothetical protein